MRNLRTKTNRFTEPIGIIQYEDIVDDQGFSSKKQLGEPKIVYAFVMNNRDIIQSAGERQVLELDGIRIQIRTDEANIQPQITRIVVRDKEYLVNKVDEFNINSETIWFTAKAV